jgi:hypothetical protein
MRGFVRRRYPTVDESVDPIALDGELLAIVLIPVDGQGNRTDDALRTRTGHVHWTGDALWLDWGNDDAPLELEPAWLARIKPVKIENRAEVAGAAYWLPLRVGPLPEGGEESGEYRPLGWGDPGAG